MSIFHNSNSDVTGFEDRFWYWHGTSGKRYIHSIYSLDACPPLPGAVFIHVKKLASGKRVGVDVGRFSHDWDYVEALVEKQKSDFGDVDEIHVHLLAHDDHDAEQIANDLKHGLKSHLLHCGFGEEQSTAIQWQANLFDVQLAERSPQRSLANA